MSHLLSKGKLNFISLFFFSFVLYIRVNIIIQLHNFHLFHF